MNKIVIGLAAVALLLSSCTEDHLNTYPQGDLVTTDQREDVQGVSPEKLSAGVQGIYAFMIEFNTLGNEDHDDFGYPAYCLSSELWGQDMVQTSSSYGWFWPQQTYTNRGYNLTDTYYFWNLFYKLVKKANDVLATVDPDTEIEEFQYFLGQARAMRAFAYLHLVQLYQHTYVGHEDDPAVPIIDEKMTYTQAGNNPRASVRAVYSMIETDLIYAIEKLDGYGRTLKVEVDQQVAYGLLARTYLAMERWGEAAEAAEFAAEGYYPMSGEEYNDEEKGFNDINNHAWMWGNIIEEVNEAVTTGICNYPSHLGSLNYGYVWAGDMFKAISKELYDQISDTDIRKEAFNGPDETVVIPGTIILAPYANVKFKPDKGVLLQDVNANDWPLMRVEEMILIQAEATEMAGGDGASILQNFMTTYRDPNYTIPGGMSVQDAVWVQRRIELWGEGFAWFDLKRLKKPMIRKYAGSNFLDDALIDLPAEHDAFLIRIPLREIQNNQGIPAGANNPIPEIPRS